MGDASSRWGNRHRGAEEVGTGWGGAWRFLELRDEPLLPGIAPSPLNCPHPRWNPQVADFGSARSAEITHKRRRGAAVLSPFAGVEEKGGAHGDPNAGDRGPPQSTLLDAAVGACAAAIAAAESGDGGDAHLRAASWFRNQDQGAAAAAAGSRPSEACPVMMMPPKLLRPGELSAERTLEDLSPPQQGLQRQCQQLGSSTSDDTDRGNGGPMMCTPDTNVCRNEQQQQRGDLYAQPADGPGGGFKVS